MSVLDHDLEATDRTGGVLYEIARERARQDVKWGEQNHPDGTGPTVRWQMPPRYAVAEDLAGYAKKTCQWAADEGRNTWLLILREEVAEAFAEDDPARLRAELVQVAAVAAQWVEAIDRRVLRDCTHGADCLVHPNTNGLHNFDPPATR